MAVLSEILTSIDTLEVNGSTDRNITGVYFDSRQVTEGSAFVAVPGTSVDGHDFIEPALDRGAVVIIYENPPGEMKSGITWIRVKNSAQALGKLASGFYGRPSESLKIVAITGTNGKTTTVTLLYHLFRKMGYRAGMFSTIQNMINDQVISATHTTPDAVQLNRLMAEMVKQDCKYCFMEASSHALEQYRLSGIKIDLGIFTNITHDHLDYHKTFDAYLAAKKKLFDSLGRKAFALVNADDKRSSVMVQNSHATIKTFGLKNPADFKSRIISNTFLGLELMLGNKTGWFQLVGEFNAYNLTAVYAAALLLGEEEEKVLLTLTGLGRVPGRFEVIRPSSGVNAIVDYAHTPDALENVLSTIRELRTNKEKLITVVGCGGNRDREKRPEMAAIACRFSDKVILTSDNPRNEDAGTIIEEMEKGILPEDIKKTLKITDRREAIKTACTLVSKNDIILLAGKGHETYQEIKGVKYDFDDRKVLAEMIDMLIKN